MKSKILTVLFENLVFSITMLLITALFHPKAFAEEREVPYILTVVTAHQVDSSPYMEPRVQFREMNSLATCQRIEELVRANYIVFLTKGIREKERYSDYQNRLATFCTPK